jgi:hypothetical protein
MLKTKDKNKIKKLWAGKDKFVHKTVKEYSPFGNFHDFHGIEIQITNGVRAGFEEFGVNVLTHNEEGGLVLKELTYNTAKKELV